MLGLMALFLSGCGKSPEAEWGDFLDAFNETHPEFRIALYESPAKVEIARRQCADADAWAARAMALAKSQPRTEMARHELQWIVADLTDTHVSKEAIEIYSHDYPDEFYMVCSIIDRHESWADHFFEAMAERSTNGQIRGQATLARARFQQIVMHDQTTAEKLLETVITQYADVKASPESAATLGELALDDLATLHRPDPTLELKAPRAGEKIPPFTVTSTEGKTVRMPDDYQGQLVLVDFWATWCVPCIAEIPNVTSAYEKYHGRGLEVLSVSLDRENAGEAVTRFTRKHGMPWPQIYDGKYIFTPLSRQFGIFGGTGIPSAFLVDGDTGLIIAEGKNARGPNLATAIESALAKKLSVPNQ